MDVPKLQCCSNQTGNKRLCSGTLHFFYDHLQRVHMTDFFVGYLRVGQTGAIEGHQNPTADFCPLPAVATPHNPTDFKQIGSDSPQSSFPNTSGHLCTCKTNHKVGFWLPVVAVCVSLAKRICHISGMTAIFR